MWKAASVFPLHLCRKAVARLIILESQRSRAVVAADAKIDADREHHELQGLHAIDAESDVVYECFVFETVGSHDGRDGGAPAA